MDIQIIQTNWITTAQQWVSDIVYWFSWLFSAVSRYSIGYLAELSGVPENVIPRQFYDINLLVYMFGVGILSIVIVTIAKWFIGIFS